MAKKPTETARSVERQRLGEAIERHRDAAEQLDRVERAIATIAQSRISDYAAIERAREALKIARTSRSTIIIARALGEEMEDQPDIPAAERVLADCEAKLDAGRAAQKTLEQARARAASSASIAKDDLDRAVKDVIAADPAVAALKAEYHRTMKTAALLLHAIRTAGVDRTTVSMGSVGGFATGDAGGISHVVERLGGTDAAWSAALQRLHEDADAQLPGVPPDGTDDAGDSKRAAAA